MPDRAPRVRRIAAYAATALASCLLAACGGGSGAGGSGAAASAPTSVASSSVAASSADASGAANLAIAQQIYDGTVRTPAGFLADPAPSGVTGVVATTHIKNTDVAAVADGAARYELCTDDMAQATAWSELASTWDASYTDLVQVSSDARVFELDRVPRSDPTAMLRHRVLRCAWLDRSGSNLDVAQGPAGVLNQRPVTAAALQTLSEYLWHFTLYNNADTIVTASVGSGVAPTLTHSIRMAQLQHGATAADCDTITLLEWVHTVDAGSGALLRSVAVLGSFRARSNYGSAQLCP